MIDFSALTDDPHPDEVRGFANWASNPMRNWAPMPRVRFGFFQALGIIVPFVIVPIALVLPFAFLAATAERVTALVILPVLFFVMCIGIFAVTVQARTRFAGFDWQTMYRMYEFAHDNGLDYVGSDKRRIQYPGQLFARGGRAYHRLISREGRFFEIGNHRIANGGDSSGDWFVHRGYMAVKLNRILPQITLEAVANHGQHTAVVGGTARVVKLEGDFNEYFTLRVPPGYERDAFYIFTPDLMALLIDEVRSFDVELVDDWMFVYSPLPFLEPDPALYDRLFHILATVGVKTLRQTSRYVDSRRNWAGELGARFRRGIPLWVVVLWWSGLGGFLALAGFGLLASGAISIQFL